MLETAIIVFRETLEASLIISIVLAASRGIAGNRRFVAAGALLGIGGALLVAGFADAIANLAAGIGQEILNAAILLAAAAMLTAHSVWMAHHGAELGREASATGAAIQQGHKSLWALALVAGSAVMREGSETALFLFGLAHEGADLTVSFMVAGAACGFCGAALLGWALYAGLAKIPLGRIFGVTNIMILLLAAGMSAQAAGFLVQADLLPTLGHALWNSSAILSEQSILGRMLHALIGYSARPAPVQLVFYASTIVLAQLAKKMMSPPVGAPTGA
jgi:high-affinity iron transporter